MATPKIKPKKVELLEHFYEHLSEDDWLEGVDLYQSGRITDTQTIHGLIMAKVASMTRDHAEVRLKIHPSGKVIQWIECTCKKNRVHGYYCEHIAAFMIHVDREKPEFFSRLDVKMPLKPPAKPKKPRLTEEQKKQQELVSGRQAGARGASQTLLDHLQGAIQSVSLLAHGPSIRVKIEIKEGTITHYDLDIDNAAKFLLSHPNPKNVTTELGKLKVFAQSAELGSRLHQLDDEKIVAERCVAIKLQRRPSKKIEEETRLATTINSCHRITDTDEKGRSGLYQFISVKKGNKYIGEEYFFLPGRGYWKIDRSETKQGWYELPLSKTFKEDDAARFAVSNYAEYRSKGPVWVEKALHRPSQSTAPTLSEIEVHSSNDGWFFLDPKYGKGKSAVSMAQLRREHRENRREFYKNGDVWMKIPDFVTEHDWELNDSEEYLKVDAMGLLRLKAAVGDFDRFVGSKSVLNQLRDRMEYSKSTKPPSIAHTKLTLRSYQEMGLKWLWWLYTNNLHGLLADEMGLGKTHQAMAMLSALQSENPDGKFLVICPTSVLEHWEDKINDFAQNLRPLIFHGPKRHETLERFHLEKSVMITSYGVLLRDSKKLAKIDWITVILDEAHYVKNNNTATYKSACRLPAKMRICLTGTPMENHLGELKNLFDFLVPGYLGSDKYFKKNFILPIERGDEPEKELALQKLIYPFKLRRLKKNVLDDLPQKVEDLRHCSLSEEQVKLYRDIIENRGKSLLGQLQDDENPVPFLHVFATLQMLKQVCNHPSLIIKGSDYRAHQSGKFELLKELLDESLAAGNKVVIFSQYVGMIKIISQYLTENSIEHVSMTGQTRNRGKLIERFQKDPNIKIFIGSLLAGGVGIDLTAASVVIHYDRWWNPSKENQATDRVHRIGQKKYVQVMKLLTRGTLEEKIDKIIAAKQSVFNRFLEKDEEIFKTLSRQDLIDLLS